MVLSLCASAQARSPSRIINGQAASQGEYPAQGFLELSTSTGNFVCGGTLVSNRYFLTAAHCATESNSTPLDASDLRVSLGKLNKSSFVTSDRYSVAVNEVHSLFGSVGPGDVPNNDVALLTLATPAPPRLEPLRIVESGETDLWALGDTATVIGWGFTEDDVLSDRLLEATVLRRSDPDCSAAWGSNFRVSTMVCAGGGAMDTCGGDSGGPLMVGDGAFLVLAGITSWGADPCGNPSLPGVYTRIGEPALNEWVRERVPMARASVSDAAPDTGQAVTFSATARHPDVPGYFMSFAWDFDSDGAADATGASPSHAYPSAGNFVARVTATGSGLDTAVAKVAVRVAEAPVATPAPIPVPVVAAPPPAASNPTPRAMATILALSRPQVRRGRFKIRVNFAQTAPSGNAFVEVFRGKRKIGTARARVRRGGSRQVSIKLSKAGRKLLRNSERKRLRVKVQVRVKRQVLGSKRLTIRL